MDDIGTEDTKPFEIDTVKEEEDAQPDPDEHLEMSNGGGRVWSVKIPKHLMERWSAVEQDNIHLATIRVYNKDPRTDRQRIVLRVPAGSDANTPSTEIDEYELDMVNEDVYNQIVVAQRETSPGSRARSTVLTGRIKHECNMRPVFSDAYRRRMRERTKAANTPTRTIQMLDDSASTRGSLNMLNVGMSASGFATTMKPKPKPAKGAFERFARMPRNQLLDILFALYREKPRWSARDLRSRTEQPEAYLKEVLAEITDIHRSGEFNGLYELKPNFKDSVKSESGDYTGAAGALMQQHDTLGDGDVDMDDEDDDEDDDMEEIS